MGRPDGIRCIAVALTAGVALCLGGVAAAAPSTVTSPAAGPDTLASQLATGPYALDFTLPTQSKSGCLVCHGDPALTRLKAGKVVSYHIDEVAYGASAHGAQQCVGCHLDFGYTIPHRNGADWQTTAKSACKNCHQEQYLASGAGVHRRATDATGTRVAIENAKPLCGDCHGSHDIPRLTDDVEGRAALRASGWQVCGRCHQDHWENYDDYYHGAAYKRGAKDAPACWDCHGWHDILPSKDRGSRVNRAHLVETCGQGGDCHDLKHVDEMYVEYAYAIHGKRQEKLDNPVYRWFRAILRALGAS